MPGKKHTHKYEYTDMGYQMLWACALPDCPHHLPKWMEKRILRAASICWKCGEEFILDEYSTRTAIQERNGLPICQECDGRAKLDLADILQKESIQADEDAPEAYRKLNELTKPKPAFISPTAEDILGK